ncbi:hypothetical protein B0H16DRAFT_1597233 [Mycena metata]|uniref:Uncharacterized protein n=1 Tax=Mycena metata TaxID=1033252 RepID=A0AAD7HFT3_9AGAR|nr:hypothetical protein B0H16DRAFT_1605655 [Mycena metata]KAJ7724131.1 hypothetical protein B0H16DRAFT_1597233 [Mycena metata]
MVDTDNAKSKRELKKLSRCMGDKLDKEKGRWVSLLAFFGAVLLGAFFFLTRSHLATWRRCLQSTPLPGVVHCTPPPSYLSYFALRTFLAPHSPCPFFPRWSGSGREGNGRASGADELLADLHARV